VPAREGYQRMATRCLRAAERLRDPAERRQLLEVAGGYMALARHVADRHDHGTAHRSADRDPALHPDDA
jgi:glutamate/tyrosine decarboxylase-like PLP-dependent enzyme